MQEPGRLAAHNVSEIQEEPSPKLAEYLHTRPSSLQRELRSLEQSGKLQQRKDGRETYLKAETRSPIFRELRRILEKTIGLIPPLNSEFEGVGIKADVEVHPVTESLKSGRDIIFGEGASNGSRP